MFNDGRLGISILGLEFNIGDTFNNTADKLKKLADIDMHYKINGAYTSNVVNFEDGSSEMEYRFSIHNKEFLRLIFAKGVNPSRKHTGYVSRLVSIELSYANWLIGRAQCIATNVLSLDDALTAFKEYDVFYKRSNKERVEFNIKHNGNSLKDIKGNGVSRYNIKNTHGDWAYSVNIESRYSGVDFMTELMIYANRFVKSSKGETIKYR